MVMLSLLDSNNSKYWQLHATSLTKEVVLSKKFLYQNDKGTWYKIQYRKLRIKNNRKCHLLYVIPLPIDWSVEPTFPHFQFFFFSTYLYFLYSMLHVFCFLTYIYWFSMKDDDCLYIYPHLLSGFLSKILLIYFKHLWVIIFQLETSYDYVNIIQW